MISEHVMANEREPVKTTDEVRGGETPGIGRYVLGISTLLIIIVFAIILIYYR
jgi:hypothetical protein